MTMMAVSSNDEPLYIVEYPDGSLSTEGYNALISALNLQLDEFGDENYTFPTATQGWPG